MDKFLKMEMNYLEFAYVPSDNFVKNPIPILLNYKGTYGWIPVEIVKNEISNWKIKNSRFASLTFTWQQAFPLRQDVGKILEEVGNEN